MLALLLVTALATGAPADLLPPDARARHDRAMVLHDAGDRDGALAELEAAYAAMPDPRAYRAGRDLVLGSLRGVLLDLHDATGAPAPLCRLRTLLEVHLAELPPDAATDRAGTRARLDGVAARLAAYGPAPCDPSAPVREGPPAAPPDPAASARVPGPDRPAASARVPGPDRPAAPPAASARVPGPDRPAADPAASARVPGPDRPAASARVPGPDRPAAPPAASARVRGPDRPAAPPDIPPAQLRAAGGATLGLGAALLGATVYGIVEEARQWGRADAVADAAAGRPLTAGEHAELLDARADARLGRRLAVGGGVASAALVGLGAALLGLARRADGPRASAAVWATPTAGGLTVRLRFAGPR